MIATVSLINIHHDTELTFFRGWGRSPISKQ